MALAHVAEEIIQPEGSGDSCTPPGWCEVVSRSSALCYRESESVSKPFPISRAWTCKVFHSFLPYSPPGRCSVDTRRLHLRRGHAGCHRPTTAGCWSAHLSLDTIEHRHGICFLDDTVWNSTYIIQATYSIGGLQLQSANMWSSRIREAKDGESISC